MREHIRRTVINGEIQLRLADAAQHEFDVFADVFWAFCALLAAKERLLPHFTYCLPEPTHSILFQDGDDGIHASASIQQVLHNRHCGV